jgi:peptide-methionine (S)-S-oxide reductase
MEKATFGAGCFWGVEAGFRKLDGVVSTMVGYTGGTVENPTYKEVCSGRTGHAEAVRIDFDPARISYEELLKHFWESHDATTPNRQGPDVGTQYRSVVFFHSPQQEALAKSLKEQLQNSGQFNQPIVTEILPVQPFYKAEEYHQRYLEKHGQSHCSL